MRRFSKSQRTIFALLGCLLFFVLLLLASQLLHPTSVGSSKFSRNIFFFALLWALLVIIILSLVFILLRNLIKLYFEYRGGRLGSRIKTRLVLTLVALSLLPSALLFLLAFGLINNKMQEWFSAPAEQLRRSATEIALSYYEQRRSDSLALARQMAREYLRQTELSGAETARASLNPRDFQFEEVLVLSSSGQALYQSPAGSSIAADPRRAEAADRALRRETFFDSRRDVRFANVDRALVAVPLELGPDQPTRGTLLAAFSVPGSVALHAIEAERAAQRYADIQEQQDPLQALYFLILGLTTVTVIFGFTWFGLYVAKKVTVPIEALAEGAREIASGNLNHRVECKAVDELGILVEGFNQMAAELQQHKHELERTNEDLRVSNLELDKRRRYIETVLDNIATGVISVTREGAVSTINRAASQILKVDSQANAGKPISAVVPGDAALEILRIVQKARILGSSRTDLTMERQGGPIHLAATATAHHDPEENETGVLLVLDDITELIRAEKFAVWQEVARRMAHEIKNPLTPIQLSAEQILRRAEKLGQQNESAANDRDFLLEVARIIVQEVRTLKEMVDEFSQFSRLPLAKPVPCELKQIIQDTLSAYNGRFEDVEIRTDIDSSISTVSLDPDQFKRALVNILDNAIEALEDTDRNHIVEIRAGLNPERESVRIEIADNGSGISATDYENLFLPYFSTKKRGTGLGLAIVRQIISEHHGHIRAEANHPQGARFIIELPHC